MPKKSPGFALSLGLFFLACGGEEDPGGGIGGNGNGGTGIGGSVPGNGGTSIVISGGTGGSGGTAGSGGGSIVTTLPPGFTPGNIGGWQRGDAVVPGAPPPTGSGSCNNLLTGIVRDLRGLPDGHPNFQMNIPGNGYGVYPGMVNAMLGADQKPVFSGAVTAPVATNAADFNEWYVSGTSISANRPFYLTLFLAPAQNGIFTFHSDEFFPLDGAGFDDESEGMGGAMHNFFFTFELHTTFRYRGGETFTFIGDDDVWVFINGRLAVDIGGVHGDTEAEVNLDDDAAELGITVGATYPLDMFHAERHTSESNFRVDTSLAFDCSVFVPDVPR